MSSTFEINCKTYQAISLMNLDLIKQLDVDQIRPVLPCLTRMVFCPSLDHSEEWTLIKKQILQIISHMEEVNIIVSLLSVDFQSLDIEIRKGFKQKFLETSNNLALDFESGNPTKKLILFFSEYYNIQNNINENFNNKSSSLDKFVQSELFDHDLYIDVLSDIICIILCELPSTIQLLDIIDVLTTVKIGSNLICRIAANFSESFHEICLHLINKSDNEVEDTFIGNNRVNIIRMLCKMNPEYALVIRSAAVENCKMPALCIYLTLDHINYTNQIQNKDISNDKEENYEYLGDLVSFISGILLGYDEKVRSWFSVYIKICQINFELSNQLCTIKILRQELLKYLNYLFKRCQTEDLSKDQSKLIIKCTALLKLYCAFKSVSMIKFNDDEIVGLLNLITIKPASTPAGIRFASIGLCILLASSSFTSNSEGEKKVIEWLHWIVNKESLFGQVAGIRSSFEEMLLLVAIHLHNNQINTLSDLINTFLGIKLPIKYVNMTKIKNIFTQEIFTEQIVTAHAIKVPVTNNLNLSIPGFLPVHCIYQLLKSRAFTKHKVPIKDWIFKQICNSTAPLHVVLPNLIEAYVNSVIISYSKSTVYYTNEPIPEEKLNQIFSYKIYSVQDDRMELEDEPLCWLTTQLLLTYYVLLYENVRLTQIKNIPPDRIIKKYTPELMSKIPIFYLLHEAKSDEVKYGILFPSLLRLISTNYSHLCLVPDWLSTEKKDKCNIISLNINIENERKRLISAFESFDKDPDFYIKVFDRLLDLPRRYLWPLAEKFIEKLHLLLPIDIPDNVLIKTKEFWWKLNSIFPDALRVMTVNALSENKTVYKKLTWEDIVKDPLQVLRCDKLVFLNPELIEIFLHILQSFLIASRIYFSHHLLEFPSKTPEEEKDREELRTALIQTQESSAIQILLEACLIKTEYEENERVFNKLKEVQKIICTHLHQVFISDPNLAKLVHFQGYDSSLLELVISKIPSMHICLDFIPELLSQPDLNKQVFSIQLCSYLCKQYAIMKSLSIAKLCYNVSNTLLPILPSEKMQKFFIPVLPALVRMCEPFPPLYEDAICLLLQISQICLSRLAARNPTFISSKHSSLVNYNGLIENLDWIQAKKFFNSLPKNDKLSLTIQSSFKKLIENQSVNDLINLSM